MHQHRADFRYAFSVFEFAFAWFAWFAVKIQFASRARHDWQHPVGAGVLFAAVHVVIHGLQRDFARPPEPVPDNLPGTGKDLQ
jgi:hypothetical protein